MLYFLAELRHLWGPLRLFEYITFRAGAAAFTAFLIVALLGSWTARKLKQMNMQAASRYEGILPPEMIDVIREGFRMLHSDLQELIKLWKPEIEEIRIGGEASK